MPPKNPPKDPVLNPEDVADSFEKEAGDPVLRPEDMAKPPENALYDVPFSPPRPAWDYATKEVPYEAHFTFYHLQGKLLNNLLLEGGPLNNPDRMYILDKNGKFTSPERDRYLMQNMEKAALDGRLFCRDWDNHLHQVRLTQNENFKYDLSISEKITEPVVPPRPEWYFIKNLLGKVFSYFHEMVKDYNTWKHFSDSATAFMADYNKDKGSNRMAQIKFAPAKEASVEQEQPVVEEPEVQQVQPEVKEQPIVPAKTVEELLEMNPMDMTTKEFATYLDALGTRGEGTLALNVILDPKGTHEQYYEALAQEMESKVAKLIMIGVDPENLSERHEKELEKQKPVIASMTRGLRDFVRNYPGREDPQVVEEFFKARADKKETMSMQIQVMNDMSLIQANGIEQYYEMVNANNKQAQREQRQQVQQQSTLSLQSLDHQMPQPSQAQQPSAPSMSNAPN